MNAEIFTERGSVLVRLIKKMKVDSFISKNPALLFHLTGQKNISGYILFYNDELKFITDRRFLGEIETIKDIIPAEIYTNSLITYLKPLRKHFKNTGIEFSRITHAEYLSVSEILKSGFIDASRLVDSYLASVDNKQLDSFLRGVDVTKTLFNHAYQLFEQNISITEKELAAELGKMMLRNGADNFSFEPIIAADENSAKPHHTPSDRDIKDCSVLLVDIGVVYDGMCTDITRTFIRNNKKAKRIESIVKRGFEQVLKQVKAGVKVSKLSSEWKIITEKNKLTENFTHALGHGLGYEVHQAQRISTFSKEVLTNNQIITLEPALYFPDEFGYRYECDILVTKDSGINLTAF
jgi:Xaa-Pro aminopeptidase